MDHIVLLLSVITLAIYGIIGGTDPESARRVLEAQGYTAIEMTGNNITACGKGDWYHTGFKAKSPNESSIKGTVCKGLLFKGSTIRFED